MCTIKMKVNKSKNILPFIFISHFKVAWLSWFFWFLIYICPTFLRFWLQILNFAIFGKLLSLHSALFCFFLLLYGFWVIKIKFWWFSSLSGISYSVFYFRFKLRIGELRLHILLIVFIIFFIIIELFSYLLFLCFLFFFSSFSLILLLFFTEHFFKILVLLTISLFVSFKSLSNFWKGL